MNFLGPNQYAFDMSGEHPDNLIIKEPLEIEPDSGSTIVVPEYGPFYAKGFELYSADGQLLTLGVDYQFFNLMGELSDYTAKKVVGIIELLRPNLTKVLATYHTLGETMFWDSNLIKLIINAAEDDRPVYWENLKDIPLGFPSEIHGQSFIYQLTSFSDFVAFIEELTETVKNAPNLVELKIKNLTTLIDSSIARYDRMLQDLVASHNGTYNAHGLKKTHVGLENVDNFPTATPEQARQGESDQLHLTPPGLAAIVNEYGYDESRLLEAEVLPMSMYGNRNFIPPTMDGSYEAIGLNYNRGIFCIEEDGAVAVLAPRFDGKVRGLYFSTITNMTEPSLISYDYTATLYEHDRLKNDGIPALAAMGGGDYEVMVIGDNTSVGMYITLTNDTFNPAKHDLKYIDITQSSLSPNLPGIFITSSIANLGDRIAVMVPRSRSVGGIYTETWGQIKMFYIDMAELKDPDTTSVVLRDWLVTYDMPDGTLIENSQDVFLSPIKVSPDDPGKLIQLYYNLSRPMVMGGGGGYRSCNITSARNPNNQNESVINVARWFYFTYRDENNTLRNRSAPNEIIWKRVGDRLTIKDCTPIGSWDLNDFGLNPHPTTNERTAAHAYQASSILSNGWRATLRGLGEQGWVNMAMFERCNKSRWEWLGECSYAQNHSIQRTGVIEKFNPPMSRGVKPLEISWTRDGYDVTHLSPMTGQRVKTNVKLHDTNLTSNLPFHEWETRAEVSIDIPVKSLPIPTVLQEKRVPDDFSVPCGNITGDSAFLASISAGYGVVVKGNHGVNRSRGGMWAHKPPLSDGTDDGVLLYDLAGDLLYYPALIVDQFKALVNGPGIHPVIGVAIADLTSNINKNTPYAGSWGAGLAIVMVTYGTYVPSTQSKYCVTYVIRPVISNNTDGLYNPNYPRIVTGFTITATSPATQMTGSEGGMTETGWGLTAMVFIDSQRRMLRGYVSGNTIHFCFESYLGSSVIGNSYTGSARGMIDLTTGELLEYTLYNSGPSWNVNAFLAVPRVGLRQTSINPLAYGGCALVINPNGEGYCLYNTFLKDGWYVYVGGTDIVFNGRVYTFDGQTLDVRDADPNYLNAKFYIYAKLVGTTPVFYLSKSKVPDTVFHMWVGVCETDGAGIKTITRQNVLSLNGIRLGASRGGSTIMASLGSVNSNGSIPWFSRDDVV